MDITFECFSLQPCFKMYHPCPVISRLILDIFPIMIVRFKIYKSFCNFLIIMIPNPFSVFGQNTFAELLSFFLFCNSSPLWLIMWSAWICGVATGQVPSDFQILFAKSPYLSAPYLLRCSNVYMYMQCTILAHLWRVLHAGPTREDGTRHEDHALENAGNTNVQIKDDIGLA